MHKNLPFTSPPLIAAIGQYGILQEYKCGQTIIEPGQYIKMIPIILEGTVKVMRRGEDGDLFLYFIKRGDTCAVSLTCCSNARQSEVLAIAEEKATILGIPLEKHEAWTDEFAQWKEYVASTYQKRFQELLGVIDDIAFKKMDERLLKYLVVKSNQLNTLELQVTHQEIAKELGSSREVISRLLKQLEKRKLVELGRNIIYIRNGIEEFL
ncbi:Crp/Fnr family transcriptional regulator [Anditalea andensis]|uniref:Crp/Fnr family transcriptional regulator n=1 Tax=Anditalea andensis TaxID=1048983 RepID=A0A074KXS5_9BACT|nr:Crp/Fnr family transcriptional regulator [Anditalea andensis]KEO73744.1 Crp/Fnr family transcriptional regulator [Anditalea andensis]